MLVCLSFFFQEVQGQAKSGLENYNFLGQGGAYTWMPVLHYETGMGLYTEIRFNYEAVSAISIFAGKKFEREGRVSYSFTPMLGWSAGTFSGISPALNAEAEWKKWFVSVQSQFSASFSDKNQSFFFNWSELGYNVSNDFFAGIAGQFTKTGEDQQLEPGILAGVEWGRLSIPVYWFRPFSVQGYFVVGLNFQYIIK
jgi:hypothetical protein